MTKIYLIRHTQAEGNLYRMMQGHWDGNITPLGKLEIEALGERFRDVSIDAVYSSDMTRTKLTAGGVLKYHPMELRLDKRLREINVGPWETKFFGNVAYSEPESMDTFIHNSEEWTQDGAETFNEVKARAYEALCEIAAANDGKTIAVVTHGVTIRCLLSVIQNMRLNDPKAIPISGNTGVTKLQYDNGTFQVEYINDLSHLQSLHVPEWKKSPELRDEAFNPLSDPDYYVGCYRDAWQLAHGGSLTGFSPEQCLNHAAFHYKNDPESIRVFYCRDVRAGLLDLDVKHGAEEGYGWITFLYLQPEYRSIGCGPQALARALNYYRERDRHSIRLNVADTNERAIQFYRENEFEVIGTDLGATGTLLIMEKALRGPHHVW